MRGYVVKKGNQYYAVIYEGVDVATGRERRSWHPGGPRKREAERLVNELVRRQDQGETVSPDRITVGAYLKERWLPAQQSQLRPSTYDAYERDIHLHVLPRLGAIRLQHLGPDDLDRLYAHLSTEGRRNAGGGGLSPKTVRKIHAIVHKALADAHRKGLVFRNVADLADAPKLRATKAKELTVWSAEELRHFLDLSAEHPDHTAWYLAAQTGMRRGELLGLRWLDVDLDHSRLHLRQAAIIVAYRLVISDIKTDTGRRTIDVSLRTVSVLAAHQETQRAERHGAASRLSPSDPVFGRADGTIPNPDIFSQSFERFVARSGLPRIRLHDLRHTHASLLLKAGVPVKVVSERLGHANPAFTLNVYQHLLPGMQADAAATFDRLLTAESLGCD